jgi:hypothetical protein
MTNEPGIEVFSSGEICAALQSPVIGETCWPFTEVRAVPTVHCPSCRRKISLRRDETRIGIECAKCGHKFRLFEEHEQEDYSVGETAPEPAEPPPVRRRRRTEERPTEQPGTSNPFLVEPSIPSAVEQSDSHFILEAWYYRFAHVCTYIFVVLTLMGALILTLQSAGQGIEILIPEAQKPGARPNLSFKPPTETEIKAAIRSAELWATVAKWFGGMYLCFVVIYSCSLVLIFIDLGRNVLRIASR